MCVKWGVCQIGASGCLSVNNNIKASPLRFFPSRLSPPPSFSPLSPSVSLSAWLSLTFPAASLSFPTLLLTSVVRQLFESCVPSVPPACYHGCQPTSSPQTLMLQYTVPLQFLHHTLSVVSCGGTDGVEEEIIVCLCRAEQTERQMASPSDAPQR